MILSSSQSQPKKNVIIELSSGWQDPPNEQLIHHIAATEVMSVYQEFSVLHIMYCTLTDLFVLTPSYIVYLIPNQNNAQKIHTNTHKIKLYNKQFITPLQSNFLKQHFGTTKCIDTYPCGKKLHFLNQLFSINSTFISA